MKRIKSYKLFESSKYVEDICNDYGIENWTLNPDGTVDVDGDVYLVEYELKKLPLKFGRVTGDFDCSQNMLTSLVGGPNWVGGNFRCNWNRLTSLEGGPNWVGGGFDCPSNNLTNLEGCPENVYDDFVCTNNKLTSLEGCPEKIFGNLYCIMNEIYSLEYYPTILTGRLWIGVNPIQEIWNNVIQHKPNNHGVLLELFWLNNPIRYENGEWVCYREFLDNFFEEISVPSPPKLKNYKEV